MCYITGSMTNYDENPLKRADILSQAYARSIIKQALVSAEILGSIEIDWYGRIKIRTITWDTYWADVIPYLSESDIELLRSLQLSRKVLSTPHCSWSDIKEYSASYHYLLDSILKKSCTLPIGKQTTVLARVLGFECFTVKWYGDRNGIAAATSTLKNPNYLLTCLKPDQTLHDPKYLAVITTADTSPELFYHYRQIKLDDEFDIRLFLYPAVSITKRSDSFEVLESFINGCSNKPDPRSAQRARSLVNSVLLPFWQKSMDMPQNENRDISIVDIGGGTGALVSNMWRYLLTNHLDMIKNASLSCSIIGLRVQDPLRHFNKGVIKGTISYLDYVQSDYLDWLYKQNVTESPKFDIAMICRLLNNVSSFEIIETNDWRVIAKLGGSVSALFGKPQTDFLPVSAFKTEQASKLKLRTKKIRLDGGKTFKHIALSDYYRGLNYLAQGTRQYNDKSVFYPLRKFNKDALHTSDGKSVFERLTRLAKLTIIEDVDLSQTILTQHISEISNSPVYASEINRQGRTNTAAVFCIAGEKYKHALPGKLLK